MDNTQNEGGREVSMHISQEVFGFKFVQGSALSWLNIYTQILIVDNSVQREHLHYELYKISLLMFTFYSHPN